MDILSTKNQGILADYITELKDLDRLISVEIASTNDEVIKAQLIATKLKTLITLVNLEKQRRNILPKYKI